MHPSLLAYPRKSHRKKVMIPSLSSSLAELMGVIFGDGGINNNWQLAISLNSISDIKYGKYVKDLICMLFLAKPTLKKRKGHNTLLILLSSTTIVDFLVENGAMRGNKLKQRASFPSWIRENDTYSKLFIRGLIDTDGCLYTHNHWIKGRNYVNIGLCFTNYCPEFVQEVHEALKKFGIKSYVKDKGRRIYVYSYKEIEKYLSIVGSSNPRILLKYKEWRSRIAVHSTRLESARA